MIQKIQKSIEFRWLSFLLSVCFTLTGLSPIEASGVSSKKESSHSPSMLAPLSQQADTLLQSFPSTIPLPPLSANADELVKNFADIVSVMDGAVKLLVSMKDNQRLLDLYRELVENPNQKVQEAAFWIASGITNALEASVDSSHRLFENLDKIAEPFTMLPENLRNREIMLQAVKFYQDLQTLGAV